MTILVTGFDPFGGEKINPAQEAVMRLPDRIGGHSIHKLIVPTVFGKAGDAAVEAMEALSCGAVICVGQAGGRTAVTPERVAINMRDAGIPDNEGNIPQEEPVILGGPAAYFSTLPVKKMAEAIRAAGLPGQVSNSTGTFVCNDLHYRVLHDAAEHMPGTRCCFIHVPYIPAQVEQRPGLFSMELEDIVRALTVAIEAI